MKRLKATADTAARVVLMLYTVGLVGELLKPKRVIICSVCGATWNRPQFHAHHNTPARPLDITRLVRGRMR